MKRVALILLGLAMASTCFAQAKDNLGFPMASKGGALSTSSTVLDESWPFERNAFDVTLGLALAGTDDQTAMNEAVLLDATLYWFLSRNFKFGPKIQWDTVDTNKIIFGLPGQLYLTRNPTAGNLWFVRGELGNISILTTDTGEPRETAFSFVPTVGFGTEFPVGDMSISGMLGAGYVVTQEGVTQEDLILGGKVDVSFRVR